MGSQSQHSEIFSATTQLLLNHLFQYLVGHVLRDMQEVRGRPLRILDVGCGSGAIGLALLHNCPRWTAVAMDVDAHAIALSRHNAFRSV